MAARDPLTILTRARAAALGYAHKTNATNVAAMLKRAQADLNRRLKDTKPSDKSFTATQLRTTLRQVEQVLTDLKPSLAHGVVRGSEVVAQGAAESTIKYIGAAEKRFKGVAGESLSINTAQVFDTAVSGARASVLRRIMTDPDHKGRPGVIDRYGEAVVGHFERTLQTAMVAGTPWDDVRNQLIEGSPFLQQAPAHWAERIVRTEFMGAHNTAGYLGMKEIDDQTGGGMIRILCATFDDRTGSDSIAYHGQIRRMDEPFDAWKGEKYLTPPNRPNDREIVVPHHMEWPLPDNLHPKSDSEVLARWQLEGRKGAPPARPEISTVPMDQIGKPIAVQAPPASPLQQAATSQPELQSVQPPRRQAVSPVEASSDFSSLNDEGLANLASKYKATILDGDIEDVQQASTKVLGRKFTNGDYAGLLNLKELQGVEFLGGDITVLRNGLSLESQFANPNPPEYEFPGKLSRRYLVDENGQQTVMHDYFVMPDSLKNNGMGAKLIEGQFRNYKRMGMDRVETHAAWDGQYVWPSMGFQLMNPADLGGLKQQFAKWAQGERPQIDHQGHMMKDPALPEPVATRPLLDALQTVNNVTDLANLKINGVAAGKEFLRWRGHTGAGPLINLEINLKDPEQWGRMNAYFESRAAKRKAKKASK